MRGSLWGTQEEISFINVASNKCSRTIRFLRFSLSLRHEVFESSSSDIIVKISALIRSNTEKKNGRVTS